MLRQPGPALQPRTVGLPGTARPLAFTLEPGLTLLEAVARPLRAAGFASAVLELAGGGFGPFAYVMPAPSPDASHAAWYSAAQLPAGGARLERGCVTFGERAGEPWLHAHASWQEAAGRRGGHVLPEETRIAAPVAARAWGLEGLGFAVAADAETNSRCSVRWRRLPALARSASSPCGSGRTRICATPSPRCAASTASPAPSCAAAWAAWSAPASRMGAPCRTTPRSCW
ncbi:hypothetical protein ACFQY5_23035 [Paeniroseomonas aquatica]|uniref:hypothetical protein n=1 Tax=Paeniroseomonas aquatica TaxID=373043 RepID=UPI0036096C2D